jgi:phosphoserine aminotransferase
MMTRGYNFGAGPATLPQEILTRAQSELLNWDGQGMSVMEISHRSKAYMALMEKIETNLRQLLAIPDNYHVFFISTPARVQFAMIPLNLLDDNECGDYLVTGTWSKMAYQEAQKLKKAHCVASGEQSRFLKVPDQSTWTFNDESNYFYYCPNETITGLAIDELQGCGDVPVVADMTSCLLSRPIDVSRYGLIFAGAQKNIAPAGLTIVIVRDDLVSDKAKAIPTMLDYKTHRDNASLYATPASLTCYMAGLMFEWLQNQGGVDAIYHQNVKKATMLYEFIDGCDMYTCPIEQNNRSIMNVAFTLKDDALDALFLEKAKANGLLALKGHRSVGGMRASIYNAMPEKGVLALIEIMNAFATEHG